MAKLLRKSLVITLSSLCTFSTCVDVKVSSHESALIAQEKLDRKLGDQIVDYDEKKEAYVNKNSTSTLGNVKDYAMDILIASLITIGSGALGAEAFRGNPVIGAIIGAIAGGGLSITYVVRNWIRRYRERYHSINEFLVKTLYRSTQESKHERVKELAKNSSTGSYSIL